LYLSKQLFELKLM